MKNDIPVPSAKGANGHRRFSARIGANLAIAIVASSTINWSLRRLDVFHSSNELFSTVLVEIVGYWFY
jgi:hypothetical protein